MKHDKFFLSLAFKLAKLGRFTTSPNPNVGCIIVQKGKIIGKGYHKYAGSPHAEICALKEAGKNAKGATAYITLEPCSHQGRTPPCVEALIKYGIKRVVSTIPDPNPKVSGRGFLRLEKEGIVVCNNMMMKEAERINSGFFKRMRTGLPNITLKLATSLDGKISTRFKEDRWITSKESRQDVQSLRAESDIILSTASTIITDDSKLNVRWNDFPNEIKKIYPKDYGIRQPIRAILDRNNRIQPSHKIIKEKGKIWLIRLKKDKNIWPSWVFQFLHIQEKKNNQKFLDLKSLFLNFGKRQINNVFIEAGSKLTGFLLENQLIDDLIIYISPKIFGNVEQSLCFFLDSVNVKTVYHFSFLSIKKIGKDIRLHIKPIFQSRRKI